MDKFADVVVKKPNRMEVFMDWMKDIMGRMECVKIWVQVLGNRVEGFGNRVQGFWD